MTLNIPPADILDQALCAQTGHPDAWWPDRATPHEEITRVKNICRTCPVQAACLEWALDNDERAGIWGGTTSRKRREMRAERRRQKREAGAA